MIYNIIHCYIDTLMLDGTYCKIHHVKYDNFNELTV